MAACAALACKHDGLLGFPCRKRFAFPALRIEFGLGMRVFVFVLFFPLHPSGWAEERRRKRIRVSDCLSEASSSSTPFSASTTGCPGAQAKGPQTIGSPSLCLLSLGEARESESPAGQPPANRPGPTTNHRSSKQWNRGQKRPQVRFTCSSLHVSSPPAPLAAPPCVREKR